MPHATLLLLQKRGCRLFLEAMTQPFHRLLQGWNQLGHPLPHLKRGDREVTGRGALHEYRSMYTLKGSGKSRRPF